MRKKDLNLENTIADLTHKINELESFVAHASHDMKEPVRSFAIGAEIIAKKYSEVLDESSKKLLQIMMDSAQRYDNTVNALKKYIMADKGPLTIEKIDLKLLLHEALEDQQIPIDKTMMHIKIPKNTIFFSDKIKLKKVLGEILKNSFLYRKKNRSLEIFVSAQKKESFFEIKIEDNGIGIDAADVENVTQSFERLHSKFDIEGLGLGLPLCIKIMKRLQGTCQIKSELNKGTIVLLLFNLP